MDGVIAGLTTALVEGGKPESLPTVRASLELSGKGLQAICDAATKTVAPNTKGVWEEIAKAAIEPLIKPISDGVGGLWARHVEKDKLAIETKRTQLEAARWPEFGDIAATVAGLALLAVLRLAPSLAQDQNAATDLYDRPVLAIDPGMHTSEFHGLAIDRDGRFAVTGGKDGTVRVWSVADGRLVRTIWVPVGPEFDRLDLHSRDQSRWIDDRRRRGDRVAYRRFPSLSVRPQVRRHGPTNFRR